MVASFSAIEPYIIQSESSGQNLPSTANYDYPRSTASGYYQITNTTWAGIPTSITGGTQSAYQASFAQQQAAANYLWTTNNGNDWLGTNANGVPWNSQAVAANNALMAGQEPNIQLSSATQSLPLLGAGGTVPSVGDQGSGITITAPGDFNDAGVPYGNGATTANVYSQSPSPGSLTNTPMAPGVVPGVVSAPTGASGAGTPVQVNLGSGTVADIGKWVTAPITAAENAVKGTLASLENWASRGVIIAVAIVILAVALWRVTGAPSPGRIMEAA